MITMRGNVSGGMLAAAMIMAHAAKRGDLGEKQAAGVGKLKQYLSNNSARRKDWSKATKLEPEQVIARASLAEADFQAAERLIEKTTDVEQRRAILGQIISRAEADASEFAEGLQPQFPEIQLEMLHVEKGLFEMGSTRREEERRDGKVTLPDFRIARFPTTNEQYGIYLAQTGHFAPTCWNDQSLGQARPNIPVVGVNWHEARGFLAWQGRKLPTEARWEYAARGPEAKEYPWGNTWDSSRLTSSVGRVLNLNEAGPVNAHQNGQSWCGAEDMLGNVWEWVEDVFGPYGRIIETYDPVAPEDGSNRVLRGGSWMSNMRALLRGAYRDSYYQEGREALVGFRAAED